MADEPIGSVSVQIVADYAKLVEGLRAAQQQAQQAGNTIAQSFSRAVSDTSSLETTISAVVLAINRLNSSIGSTVATHNSAAGAAQNHARALHGVVTEVQATSGAIRVLEGNGALRAVENFVAKTLGVGPALKAIFPIVGGLAFVEVLHKLTDEMVEFFQHSLQGGERARGEFSELNNGIETTIDEVQLANDKLDQQIAKLTGKHQNSLKAMIDEAAVSVDHLATKLDNALAKLYDIVKKEEVGFREAAVTNQGTTNIGGVQPFTEQLGGKSGLGGARADIADIQETARQRIKAAAAIGDLEGANNARLEARNAIEKQYLPLIERQAGELRVLSNAQALHNQGGMLDKYLYPDQSKNIELARESLRNLRNQQELASSEFQNATKEQTVTKLKGDKESVDSAKKAAEDRLHAWEESLAQMKSNSGSIPITSTEERDFWRPRLQEAIKGGEAYKEVRRHIENEIGSLSQKITREGHEADLREIRDQAKDYEAQLKEVMDKAEDSTGRPKQAGLEFVQKTIQAPTLDEGTYQKALEELPKLTREAAREATEALRQSIKDQDQAWEESGRRSAQDVKDRADNWREYLGTIKSTLPGINSLIEEQAAKSIAAAKRIREEQLKVTEIGTRNTEASGVADTQKQKIAIESEYNLRASHTAQDQIAHAKQIAASDAHVLSLKLDQADANVQAAKAEGDIVKIKQAELAQADAQRAIDLQAEESAARLLKLRRDLSFTGMIDKGLVSVSDSAVARLASGIASLSLQTKGWGTEFRNILKEIEKSIVEMVAKAALLKGLDVLKGKFGKGGEQGDEQGGGVLGTAVGAAGGVAAKLGGATVASAAQTANTAAITADTTAVVANTAGVTALIAAGTASIAAMTADTAGIIANTAALIALTAAVLTLIDVEITKSILGFAGGGDPDPDMPFIAGEHGPEVIHPKGRALTVVPADKTRNWMQQVRDTMPNIASVAMPQVPQMAFAGAGGSAEGTNSNTVNNHNVGDTVHNYNIYGARDPRETMRQIADYQKRQTGKFSPANS